MITPGKHQLEVVEKFIDQDYRLIGDSMGVGKTLSGVLLDFEERRRSAQKPFRTLIVCQKNGLAVWRWHLEDQGVPSDRILVIDPGDRAPFDRELSSGALNYDYYVLHYAALTLLEFFGKIQIGKKALVWDHIIADEVHMIKGRNSARTKALKAQKARKKTGLSGTPADDKPLDIWSIWNWLDKKSFSSYWRFYDEYVQYEEKVNHRTNTGYRQIIGTKNMREYHERVAPHYIRRTLHDVRDDMPPKTHTNLWVDMSARQRRDYEDMKKFQIAHFGEDDEELVVLWQIAMWQRLSQMTLGTVQALDWTKYDTFWDRWRDKPRSEWPKHIPTGPLLVLGDPSPKADAVMEKVEEAMDEGESLVVFSQYKSMVEMVVARCRKARVPTSIYHGGITSQTRRDAAVADFQSRKSRVFVGTIGAAGTSITLTAAHNLIFTDRHWNPSVNRQAEDRIWRLNQPEPCQIIDIRARGTVDDDKVERIWEKGRRVDAIVEIPDFLREAVLL